MDASIIRKRFWYSVNTKFLSYVWNIWVFESIFSIVTLVKSKHRSSIFNENLVYKIRYALSVHNTGFMKKECKNILLMNF